MEGARPIPNSKVIIFLNNSLKSDYLYDDKILPTFLKKLILNGYNKANLIYFTD